MQIVLKLSRSTKFGFSTFKVPLPPFQSHIFPANIIPSEAETNKEELLKYFTSMSVQRLFQEKAEELYKEGLIRGFLHLEQGQESIYEGIHAGCDKDDNIITSYRDHCLAYLKGYTPRQIIAELLGKSTGASKGKGGSMHFYRSRKRFYGGHGIVADQVPLGTGFAFCQKYLNKKNISVILFGDGAAKQGQVYEAANMAKLWKLPAVYLIENNQYAFGTPVERSTANPLFYKHGDTIPGLRLDGHNVLAVREAIKFCREYCPDKGPVFLELMTYRYNGHSMTDPDNTYRNKEEIIKVKKEQDCITYIKGLLLQNNLATQDELNSVLDKCRKELDHAVQQAKEDPTPTRTDLTSNVYVNNDQHYIRGIEYDDSLFIKGCKN